MLGLNTIIYITMSGLEKLSIEVSFTIMQKNKEDSKYEIQRRLKEILFTQSTTGYCRCQRIIWIQRTIGHISAKCKQTNQKKRNEEIKRSPLAYVIPKPQSTGKIKNIPRMHHYVFAMFLYSSINKCLRHCQRQDTEPLV